MVLKVMTVELIQGNYAIELFDTENMKGLYPRISFLIINWDKPVLSCWAPAVPARSIVSVQLSVCETPLQFWIILGMNIDPN